MGYKESPLCSRGSVLGLESTESLASPKLWCPVFLSEPSYNISGELIWDSEGSVFTSLSPVQLLWPARRATTRRVGLRGGSLSPGKPRRHILVTQRKLKRFRNQLGSPTYQTAKNLGLNSSWPQEADPLPARHLSN
jgi:hypothetical protein